MENELNELRQSTTNSINTNNSNNTTNNTINNTTNLYINYLNSNCKDAMSMTEFIDNIVITKDDILKFLTNYYPDVLAEIFINRLKDIPTEQRPLHCIAPSTDLSGSFMVKTPGVWKEELENHLDTHIRDVEDDEEYATMTMPVALENIRDKVYDKYEEERQAEPKLAPIRNKMISAGSTEGKIEVLKYLLGSDDLRMSHACVKS